VSYTYLAQLAALDMNELAISSDDEPPEPPSVDDELQHILQHQMYLFGLFDNYSIESNIIKQYSDAEILHNWLDEDGCGGELELLYRSSRDGQSGAAFHSQCDNKGPAVVIIETSDGAWLEDTQTLLGLAKMVMPPQRKPSSLRCVGLDFPLLAR
jgi:hypothetical protein